MTCAIHSYRLDGRCFVCGHVNEAIRADQAEADARHREYAKAYAITSAIAAAREAGRRDVLEGAAGVETSLLKLAAVAYSQGTHAVRARIGDCCPPQRTAGGMGGIDAGGVL